MTPDDAYRESLTAFLRRAIPYARPRSWRSIQTEAEEFAPREFVRRELFDVLRASGFEVVWVGRPGSRSVALRPDPYQTQQVPCPKCGARPDRRCVRLTHQGGHTHNPHTERDVAFMVACGTMLDADVPERLLTTR